MKRYDAIRYCDMGGFSWSPDDIKECVDGELLKREDVLEAFDTIEGRVATIIKEAYDDCDDERAHVHEIAAIYIEALKRELEISTQERTK